MAQRTLFCKRLYVIKVAEESGHEHDIGLVQLTAPLCLGQIIGLIIRAELPVDALGPLVSSLVRSHAFENGLGGHDPIQPILGVPMLRRGLLPFVDLC